MSQILIVDDEPSVLDVLATLLTYERHTVQTASNGRVALDLIADDLPDLLITGVLMPIFDGWALLTYIREHIPALPVIVSVRSHRRPGDGTSSARITRSFSANRSTWSRCTRALSA